MARHGYGRSMVDTFIVIPQRSATCNNCGTTYQGAKEKVTCLGCGEQLVTNDVRCTKKLPTGIWNVTTLRARPKRTVNGQARDSRETVPN